MSGANVDNVFDRVETKVKGLLDENAQLREQNRVLASHLNNLVEWALEVTKDWTVDDDSTLANDLRMIWQAQAALTATSQEVL